MSPQPKDRRGPALPSHDDFAQLLAREEKLHGFKTLKELFQAAIIEELDGGAQAALRESWVDLVGLGRVVLSYPELLWHASGGLGLQRKLICRTFSDCTTAPRNGMVSGCYPLDKYYTSKPEFQKLKAIKKNSD